MFSHTQKNLHERSKGKEKILRPFFIEDKKKEIAENA
jgi:hypothetical protein